MDGAPSHFETRAPVLNDEDASMSGALHDALSKRNGTVEAAPLEGVVTAAANR